MMNALNGTFPDDDDGTDFLEMQLRELIVSLDDRFGRGAWKIFRYGGGLIVSGPGQTITADGGDA